MFTKVQHKNKSKVYSNLCQRHDFAKSKSLESTLSYKTLCLCCHPRLDLGSRSVFSTRTWITNRVWNDTNASFV